MNPDKRLTRKCQSATIIASVRHLLPPTNKQISKQTQTEADQGSDKLVKCDWSCVALLVGGLPPLPFLSDTRCFYQVMHYQYVSPSPPLSPLWILAVAVACWLGLSPASIVQWQLLSADHSVMCVCLCVLTCSVTAAALWFLHFFFFLPHFHLQILFYCR